jgi:hypothetical protein
MSSRCMSLLPRTTLHSDSEQQLQRFLGMVNFYRRFLLNCAQVLKPLTDLLKGGPKLCNGPPPLRRLSSKPNAS